MIQENNWVKEDVKIIIHSEIKYLRKLDSTQKDNDFIKAGIWGK